MIVVRIVHFWCCMWLLRSYQSLRRESRETRLVREARLVLNRAWEPKNETKGTFASLGFPLQGHNSAKSTSFLSHSFFHNFPCFFSDFSKISTFNFVSKNGRPGSRQPAPGPGSRGSGTGLAPRFTGPFTPLQGPYQAMVIL